MVMLYTMLFCPMTMVISRDLGQFGLVYLTKLYGYIKFKFTWVFKKESVNKKFHFFVHQSTDKGNGELKFE